MTVVVGTHIGLKPSGRYLAEWWLLGGVEDYAHRYRNSTEGLGADAAAQQGFTYHRNQYGTPMIFGHARRMSTQTCTAAFNAKFMPSPP
eukprot:CAMPEP_0118869592 /NCGR_PEP_ID=MMETSP1163-20130328/12884_1 /TAXON_ID=124430 /ORGANISM="Phaeomonas parva, Strain CCMP2877" /LENGTH=88 /DNA_ID=CAMNT_0006804501 /DNA_START=23 /DNA_END=285 /DNA_ORIENTATION=-